MATRVETTDIEIRATIGVDTHAEVHVAVALDQLGRRLGAIEIPTTTAGFDQLLDWASHFGVVEQFGIEGTSSYGAGLCRWLRAQGLVVIEVDRPDRKTRRTKGKSDPIDAEAAARTVLAGEARGTPKSQDGPVEQIRVLRVAKRSAMKNRTMAANQMTALVTTAPQQLRDDLRDLSTAELVEVAAAFRFAGDPDTIVHTTKYTLRELARRHQQLTEQLDRLNHQGGDRQANAALHRIAMVRLRHEQRTQDYVARRQQEGKSKREAIRCVKRYIAREVYKILRDNPHLAPA